MIVIQDDIMTGEQILNDMMIQIPMTYISCTKRLLDLRPERRNCLDGNYYRGMAIGTHFGSAHRNGWSRLVGRRDGDGMELVLEKAGTLAPASAGKREATEGSLCCTTLPELFSKLSNPKAFYLK